MTYILIRAANEHKACTDSAHSRPSAQLPLKKLQRARASHTRQCTHKHPILHLVTWLGAHRQRALQAQPPDLLREPVRVRAHHRAKDDPAAAHLHAGGPELAPGQITNNSRGTVVSIPSARHFVHRVRKSAGPGLPYDDSLRLCKR